MRCICCRKMSGDAKISWSIQIILASHICLRLILDLYCEWFRKQSYGTDDGLQVWQKHTPFFNCTLPCNCNWFFAFLSLLYYKYFIIMLICTFKVMDCGENTASCILNNVTVTHIQYSVTSSFSMHVLTRWVMFQPETTLNLQKAAKHESLTF